jgi:hypothetical protein
MKRYLLTALTIALVLAASAVRGQSYQARVLLLDMQKLSRLKATLKDMKKDYQRLSQGYDALRDVSRAAFELRKSFQEALWNASPAVRGYWKISAVITLAREVARACTADPARLVATGDFPQGEADYLSSVYQAVAAGALKRLEELTILLTEHAVEMTDAERLAAVDRIYQEIRERQTFVTQFTARAATLARAREAERGGARALKELY